MYTLITVLIFIVCILLILIVLVQNSKGGGLASNFQSSNQVMGLKTTDFLEKATWVLAVSLVVLAVLGSAFIPRERVTEQQSRVQDQIQNAVDPTQVPNFPTTAPEGTSEDNIPTPATEENDGGEE